MPIRRIEVSEYECRRCAWRWINRVNGKDGNIPIRCAKCKRLTWNRPRITQKEIGLRKRINSLQMLYETNCHTFTWPKGLTEQFLNLDPQPTIAELQQVLISAKLKLTSQHKPIRRNPDRDKPLKQDVQRIQDVMRTTIESRNLRVVVR